MVDQSRDERVRAAGPPTTTPTECRFCPISLKLCEGSCVFAEVLNNITVGMIGIDRLQQVVFYQNPVAREVLGSPPDPSAFEHVHATLFAQVDATCPSEEQEGVPQVIRRGERFVGFTVYHVSERHCWIYLMDVTERIRLASIAEAINLAENTGYVFAGIRHELGNPLNSIKMTLHLLRRNLQWYSLDKSLSYLDRALAEVDRAGFVLKALRNFNMFEHPEPEVHCVAPLLKRFLAMIRRDFSSRGIAVEVENGPGTEWILVDPRAFQQVLLNLAANASDALSDTRQPKVVIRLVRSAGRVAIVIEDNGRGMTSEQLGNLFKPFYTNKTNGTGLGLVIVQRLMAMMNGSIEVASIEGVGTTVTLTLLAGEPTVEPA